MTELRLLGQPTFVHEGTALELAPEGPTWLLALLACRGGWFDRGEAAAVFWPDDPEASARHNLSQLLYRSRRQPWAGLIEAEQRRIRFSGSSDVGLLQRSLAAADWPAALKAWNGPLLGTMSGPDVHTWNEWLEAERENLLAGFKEAALAQAASLAEEGQADEAASLLRRALSHDALDETVLQAFLSSAGKGSQRAAAVSVYHEFLSRLDSELGLAPLPETQRLAAQLQSAAAGKTVPGMPAGTLQGAPARLHGLVARERELARLTDELQSAGTRLLTVTGPGGMGKTSLVLEAGRMLAEGYDLAAFVELAPLTAPDHFLAAVAGALDIELRGPATPEELLATFLAEKNTLLVLDNFEHLLPAVPVLARLLERPVRLDVLVSSRESLGIRGEAVIELCGLKIPGSEVDSQFEDYGAVRLFRQLARSSVPDLDASTVERADILEILCSLDGLPLGIELAVPWLRLLPAAELAVELKRSHDLLQVNGQSDLPERHRSLAAAFNHSWELLGETERSALARLAIFRGPFTRDAAQAVSGADLTVLLSLLKKSLIRRVAGSRFELQVAARQHAANRLEAGDQVRDRHATWLAQLAAEAEVALNGSGQKEWLDRLSGLHDDFLAAIDWALQSNQATLGLQIATSLQQLWWLRGPYRLGADQLLRLTELASAAESPLLAKGLHRAGTLLQELGESDATAKLYERALKLATAAGDQVMQADALHSQGYLLDRLGKAEAAMKKFSQAVELYQAAGFLPGESASLNSLAVIHSKAGRFSEARQLFEQSLEQKRQLGQPQGVAYALHNLGMVHQLMGSHETGRRYIAESTELKRQIGDVPGVISASVNEAFELLEAGSLNEAARAVDHVVGEAWRIGNFFLLLQGFIVHAGIEAASGRLTESALLSGALEFHRRRLKVELLFSELHDRNRATAERNLGSKELGRLLAQGAALTLEQLHDQVRASVAAHQATSGYGQQSP